MRITCPACAKRPVEVDAANATCGRCGCDLSIVRDVLQAATGLLQLAKSDLERGDWSAALVHAERSWALTHTPQSARVACLATAALGEGEMLARWRRRVGALAAVR